MKFPMPSSLDLQNLHYENSNQISDSFTIWFPISSLWNLQCLHSQISDAFTIRCPHSSLWNLQSPHCQISYAFAITSPVSSLWNLQILHYAIYSPNIVHRHPNLCCSCNSRLTKLAISHSKHSGLRTERTAATQSSDETHVGLRQAPTKADTPTMCVSDVSWVSKRKCCLFI